MKWLLIVGIFWALMLDALLGLAGAQQQTWSAPSLGELARQLKSDRAKVPPKPAKVFTNDNLPTQALESNLTAGATVSSSPGNQTKPEAGSSPTSASPASGAHNEKYYRKALADLRDRKEMHERELSVLEKKLGQNQMQYYPDPLQSSLQQFSRSDINKFTQDIQNKKQQIAADDKAMDDLAEQLHREGGPPGWLR